MVKLVQYRFVQWVFLLAGIFFVSLLAIQPFTLNQMPETADGILHLYRVAVTDYSLKVDNPLWLRYSTGIVYGYGAPLFNYFPPLSYYLGSWLHTFGLTFVQSWLMLMVAYTMLSALGMFFLGRIWTQSNVGGWVAAIAYIYAPYFLFDSVARGTSSELAALAILPFALYGFTRLAFYGRRTDFLFAVLALALFIPMHTLITLHGTVLLAVYCLFLWRSSDDKARTFVRLLLAGLLGFLITAFFWMPAILETSAVKIDLIAENLDQIDVTQHLRSLSDILALPHTADPTQQGQSIPITLSWVQMIISGFGLFVAMKDDNRLYHHLLLFLAVIVTVLVFLNTPASEWIWVNVPLMSYTQFPWRILGLASLLLALMTGISVWLLWTTLLSGWQNLAVFGVLALIIVAYAIPWSYSLYLGEIELNDIRDVHTFERDTGQLTVSSYSEYLPISTDESQLDANRLIERFDVGDVIPRLLESETLEIASQEWTSTSGRLRLKSAQAQSITFDWLHVNGWTVSIDGENLEVYPSLPEGLVTVDIPEGDLDLDIYLQATPIQLVSVIISFVGLALIGIVSVFWRFFSGFSNLHDLDIQPQITTYIIIVAVGIGVFLFKSMVVDGGVTSFMSQRFGDLSSENAQISPLANFGNEIDLLEAKLGQIDYDQRIMPIQLYWKLHEGPIDRDYSAVIRMRNPKGIVIAEQNEFLLGTVASSNWLPNAYSEQVFEFVIPEFTHPVLDGFTYSLDVSLFDSTSLETISVINSLGNPEDSKFKFAELTLLNAFSNSRPLAVNPMSESIGLYLPQFPNFPDSASVGEEIVFDWTWQKTMRNLGSYDHFAYVQWINSMGNIVDRSESFELTTGFATSNWRVGDVANAHHTLIVPPTLVAGDYQIGIQLVDGNELAIGTQVVLNQVINISEPDRILDEPIYAYDEQVDWNNHIRLLGYDIVNGTDIDIVWRTSAFVENSLRLFVHILDENDFILAQSDGIPVNWTRPTTSWIPDEFVTTTHTVGDLPAGEYRIRVGWYDPISGDRVIVGESDAYILQELLIVD